MTIHDLLSTIGALFGLAGIAGAILAYLQTTRQSTTVEILSKDNKALRDRVDTLEMTEQECQTRLSKLETQNSALTEKVTSAAKVDELSRKITDHHDEVMVLLRGLRG
jgi:predicted nuclease with TOPRIM domain